MLGVGFGTPDKQFVLANYSQFIAIKNSVATVTLPPLYVPKALSTEIFGLDFCNVNVQSLGCVHDAEQLEKHWQELDSEGLPLNSMSQAIIAHDIYRAFANYLPAVPSWASLPQLVDFIGAIEASKRATGFDRRKRQVIKNLRGIMRRGVRFEDQNEFIKQVVELSKAIDSWLGELRVLWFLIKNGHTLSLPPTGNDFTVSDMAIKIESKARLEHMPKEMYSQQKQQNVTSSETIFSAPGLLMTIALLISDEMREAFERQQAQILTVDISHTFCGWLLPAASQFGNAPLDFERALDEAISLAKQGMQSVVVYVHNIGTFGRFYALAMARHDAELFITAGRETLRTVEEKLTSRQILELLTALRKE